MRDLPIFGRSRPIFVCKRRAIDAIDESASVTCRYTARPPLSYFPLSEVMQGTAGYYKVCRDSPQGKARPFSYIIHDVHTLPCLALPTRGYDHGIVHIQLEFMIGMATPGRRLRWTVGSVALTATLPVHVPP